MSQSAKVSVVVLNWNGRKDTLECLESLQKVRYRRLETIVVDNGSSDGSPEAVRSRFGDRVVLLANSTNQGFCGGNNIGIRHALKGGAQFILMLNNDTIVEADVVGELQSVFDRHSGIGAVSPLIGSYHQREVLQFYGTMVDLGNGELCRQYQPADIFAGKEIRDIDFVNGCALFFPKATVEKVGLLDERFFAYYEDVDWSMRCREAGLRTVLYPKTLVFHKGSNSTGGADSPTVCFYLHRNRFLFMKKHAGLSRKLQFSFNYLKNTVARYQALRSARRSAAAEAVADGFWSALTGCLGVHRAKMPAVFFRDRLGAGRRLELWLMIIGAFLRKDAGEKDADWH